MLALAVTAATLSLAGCPHDASLGTVTFVRGNAVRAISLGDCRERIAHGRAPRAARAPVSPGGQFELRWDVPQSNSLAADGVALEVETRSSGARHLLSRRMLGYPDYTTWCGTRTLVFVDGFDRVATHDKRLMLAAAPDWRPRPLWRDPRRAFGSVACAPDGKAVAVLAQAARNDANFFHARWQLWCVGLDGSRRLLDQAPAGSADESPRWSRDGRSLLFVRERRGVGRLMLWRSGHVTGPIASFGYSLGYYGHHDWWATARWSDAAAR